MCDAHAYVFVMWRERVSMCSAIGQRHRRNGDGGGGDDVDMLYVPQRVPGVERVSESRRAPTPCVAELCHCCLCKDDRPGIPERSYDAAVLLAPSRTRCLGYSSDPRHSHRP